MKKIKYILILLLLVSCSSNELKTEESSVNSRILVNILQAFNTSALISKDTIFDLVGKNSLVDNYVNENKLYNRDIYNYKKSRLEIFTLKNRYNMEFKRNIDTDLTKKNRKLIIVSVGGAYIHPLSPEKRDSYFNILSSINNPDVMFIDYHMGYQFRYPAQNDDFMNAMALAYKLGYDPNNIVVIGDSSGTAVILQTLMYMRDKKLPMPKGMVLMSTYSDMTNTLKSREENYNIDVVLGDAKKGGKEEAFIYRNNPYLSEIKDLNNKYVSPVFGDFHNFPKALLQVGSNEILLDDSLIVHKKLLEANVDSKIEIYKGMFHVFQYVDLEESKIAIESIRNFIFDLFNDKKYIKYKITNKMIDNMTFNVKYTKKTKAEIQSDYDKININLQDLTDYWIEYYNYYGRGYLNNR